MSLTHARRGGAERVRRDGEGLPVQVLILPALFDEANRMRRLTVEVMRALAAAGVGSALPDLPGTGESEADLAELGPEDWDEALSAALDLLPPGPRRVAAFRAGAALVPASARAWCFAPVGGAEALRDVRRVARAGGDAEDPYPMRPDLRDWLARRAVPPHARTVRLDGDPRPADAHVPGVPLWRRAEPGEDGALAAALAADLAAWALCGPC